MINLPCGPGMVLGVDMPELYLRVNDLEMKNRLWAIQRSVRSIPSWILLDIQGDILDHLVPRC
jgi:hypothetical protein